MSLTNLLSRTVTVVHPLLSVDSHGNQVRDYGPSAPRVTVSAWLQQDTGARPTQDGRDPVTDTWLAVVDAAAPIAPYDRVEVDGMTLDVVDVAPVHTPAALHHLEVTLRRTLG